MKIYKSLNLDREKIHKSLNLDREKNYKSLNLDREKIHQSLSLEREATNGAKPPPPWTIHQFLNTTVTFLPYSFPQRQCLSAHPALQQILQAL